MRKVKEALRVKWKGQQRHRQISQNIAITPSPVRNVITRAKGGFSSENLYEKRYLDQDSIGTVFALNVVRIGKRPAPRGAGSFAVTALTA